MNNQDYYNKEYVPQVNKIGKITGLCTDANAK